MFAKASRSKISPFIYLDSETVRDYEPRVMPAVFLEAYSYRRGSSEASWNVSNGGIPEMKSQIYGSHPIWRVNTREGLAIRTRHTPREAEVLRGIAITSLFQHRYRLQRV